jgi:mannose-6-phosphate isomerase class I
VPEENSLLLGFGEHAIELPAIDLVLHRPAELLGQRVREQFGDEFPIRFDFLDTMGGGNLSLQVHPLTEHIRDEFGWGYTQDESYYLLDAEPAACVYLGLREGVEADAMLTDLQAAQEGGSPFPAERYVNVLPARKHDHFLIPAGTVHCSGAGSMVLEISATPYIFTFKLWDWERLGLDGRPRPINIERGRRSIRWDRDTGYVERELVNAVTPLDAGDGWVSERTGLHPAEPLETHRHWFTAAVPHRTHGSVNVLNLVEGEEVTVEGDFPPFVVHYAETFVVPASVGSYTVRPSGPSEGQRCATIKAFVRQHGEPVSHVPRRGTSS